jgi:hypothetical protein
MDKEHINGDGLQCVNQIHALLTHFFSALIVACFSSLSNFLGILFLASGLPFHVFLLVHYYMVGTPDPTPRHEARVLNKYLPSARHLGHFNFWSR